MADNGSLVAANVLTSAFDTPITQKIMLWDDTLRDGEQTVGVCFTLEQKLEITKLLQGAGITAICAGFPAVSEEERESTRAIMKLRRPGDYFHCLCRAVKSDIDAAMSCGADSVGLFIGGSDLHLEKKHKLGEGAAFEKLTAAMEYAASKNLRVCLGIEDSSRAPIDRLVNFVKEIAAYDLDGFFFCDTVGILTPHATEGIVRVLVDAAGKVPVYVHFHNDLGLAVANSIVAMQAGAQGVEGSFVGLGERAGNACLEEVAVILRVKYGLDLGIDLEKLVAAARRIAEIAKMPISPSKPILGSRVFSHESGIHVHGVTSDPGTYEPFPPALIGRRHEIEYGKHSGIASVRYLAGENGIEASPAVLEETLRRIKTRTVELGSPTPAEAATILRDVVAMLGATERQ